MSTATVSWMLHNACRLRLPWNVLQVLAYFPTRKTCRGGREIIDTCSTQFTSIHKAENWYCAIGRRTSAMFSPERKWRFIRSSGWIMRNFFLPFSLVVESRTISYGGVISRNSLLLSRLRSTHGAIVSRAPEDSQPKRDSAQGDQLSQVSGEGGRINWRVCK